jgi:Ca-activated chloride channel family protein
MSLSVSRHRRRFHLGWTAGAVGLGLVIVAAGATVAVLRYAGGGCADPTVTLNVASSPDQFLVLSRLAERWNGTEPRVGGRCAEAAVQAIPASAAAATLSPDWEEERDGPAPDVWMPDASVWLTVAAARPDAAGLLPAEPPPSLASSPVVLAMQQPMAEALGWPDQEIGWTDLLGTFGGGQTWEQFGHPEWGKLRLGIADPTRTTAGLGAVLTVLDLDGDNQFSDQELVSGIAFSQLVTDLEDDTSVLLRSYQENGEPAELAAGFPVLERELAAQPADGASVPLVPVYVKEGIVVADYPYAVLRAPWMNENKQRAAAEFLDYLREPESRQEYAAAGFRDAALAATDVPLLAAERGFRPELAGPPRQASAEGLAQLIGFWPVLIRPNNVLIVLDTSGSMDDIVPGTDQTRLRLLQSAATQGIALLNNQTVVGLWEFSSGLTPTTPYRELVPLGPASEEVSDGVDRRQAMLGAIQGLQANGGTCLYDTVHDGYLAALEAWQPDTSNMFVVITDGRDEDCGGRSLEQLLAELGEAVDPDRPLPIIALAVGQEADAEALDQITEVTGGRTVIGRDDTDAIQQVVLAFAGRIS